jgi:hypothetical protein
MIETPRLILRPWVEKFVPEFSAGVRKLQPFRPQHHT